MAAPDTVDPLTRPDKTPDETLAELHRRSDARTAVRAHYDAFAEDGFSEDVAAKLALAAVMREQDR